MSVGLVLLFGRFGAKEKSFCVIVIVVAVVFVFVEGIRLERERFAGARTEPSVVCSVAQCACGVRTSRQRGVSL